MRNPPGATAGVGEAQCGAGTGGGGSAAANSTAHARSLGFGHGSGRKQVRARAQSVTPQVSVHLNSDHCTPFKLKRKMWEINSKRRGQIKVEVYKRN